MAEIFGKQFPTLSTIVTCRALMDGTFDDIDPDEVDAEVGNFWRTLYKLEKTFSNQANPEAMSSKVCSRVLVHFLLG